MSTLETLASTITLRELADKSGRSISEVVAFAMPNGHRNGAPEADKPVDTRSHDGREAYDTQVLAALQKRDDWTLATDLRSDVGGTPLQMRTALARLLDRDLVEHRGQARATQYRATGSN